MKAAVYLLEHQLASKGDIVISTSKYYSSNLFDDFIDKFQNQFHEYHTIGHKIYSTVELPTILHTLRSTHREDILVKAVATAISQYFNGKPSVTSSQSIPWGKQSYIGTSSQQSSIQIPIPSTTVGSSASATMSTLLTSELGKDGNPLSKTAETQGETILSR